MSLILPKESFKLMGLLFEVHNAMGPIYKEKHYGDGVEEILKREQIKYAREKQIKINFKNLRVPNFAPDFIIWGLIILDIKAKKYIQLQDIRQMSRYLNEMKLPLGIVANFKRKKLEYKRIVNPNRDKTQWP